MEEGKRERRLDRSEGSMKKAWERGRKRRTGRGDNNEGLRPSEAHGSGCTSIRPPPASSCSAAQRVGAESLSLHSKPACRSGKGGEDGGRGAQLASANCSPTPFFPLSLRLCADSHVEELIKPHVLPYRSWGGGHAWWPAGGATAPLMDVRAL